MIVRIGIPAIVRAKPPRCAFLKQVLCTAVVDADVEAVDDAEMPVVARWGSEPDEAARFGPGGFYRRVCDIEDAGTDAKVMLQQTGYIGRATENLLEDERRNGVRTNEHTWPPRKGMFRPVSLDEVLAFDNVDAEDVAASWREAHSATSRMKAVAGGLWIECGEPCYVIGDGPQTGAVFAQVGFSDRDTGVDIDTRYLSADDYDAAVATLERVCGSLGKTVRPSPPPYIDVTDESCFTEDFDRRAFLNLARGAAWAVARLMARQENGDWSVYMIDVGTEDVDTWNGLRKAVARIERTGEVEVVDEETLHATLELWERLGGSNGRNRRYMSAEACRVWTGEALDAWQNRRVEIAAVGAEASPPARGI